MKETEEELHEVKLENSFLTTWGRFIFEHLNKTVILLVTCFQYNILLMFALIYSDVRAAEKHRSSLSQSILTGRTGPPFKPLIPQFQEQRSPRC